MTFKNKALIGGLSLIALIIVGLVGLQLVDGRSSPSDLPIYDQLGGDFSLEATAPDFGTLSQTEGRVVLLSFGFTSCEDICPLMLDKYRRIYQQLDNKGLNNVVMYFVTVDPARDTLEVMTEHFKIFDRRIVGLTGSQQQLEAVRTSLAVMAKPITGTDQVAHSDRIFLFDKQNRLRAMPSLTDSVEGVVQMIQDLSNE